MIEVHSERKLRRPRSGDFRAVLFDLDGTLRVNRPAGADVFYGLLESYGHRVTDELRRRATRWVHGYWADSDELYADLLDAGGSMAGLYRHFASKHMAALGLDLKRRQFLVDTISSRMRAEYRPESVVPEGVPEMLEGLAGAGYRLGLLSNRDVGLRESSENHALNHHFEIILEAGEVRRWKPHPEFFWEALGRIGVPASEAVYIGDNYFADVLGARSAGLQSILLDPEGLFPEAQCPVIEEVTEVPRIMGGE